MTGRRGVPASEQAELGGLLYRADQARGDLGSTLAAASARLGDGPARRQWIRDRAASAVRGLASSAGRAGRRRLARARSLAGSRGLPADGRAAAAVIAAAVLATAVLAAHARRRPGLARR